MSPVPGVPHEWLVSRVRYALIRYQTDAPGIIGLVATRAGVVIESLHTVREPDIAVYDAGSIADLRSWADVAPAIVIEVTSIGQEARDLIEKRADYQLAGINEYWIIDPARREVAVLTRAPAGWSESTLRDAARLTSALLPGCELEIAALFADIDVA